MKNLRYALRQVCKLKPANFVKIISLTLGFALSALMLTRYAYDLTYDGFYPDAKRIYLVYNDHTIGEQTRTKDVYAFAPLAPALKEEVSGVQAATRFYGPGKRVFVRGNKEYAVQVLRADGAYFDVFGYTFVKGDALSFAQPGTVFLSQTKAAELFGDQDPMGALLVDEDDNTYTVGAIFEDIPRNSSWDIEAVSYSSPAYFSNQWDANHSAINAVLLQEGYSPKEIDASLQKVVANHFDVDAANRQHQSFHVYLHPLDTHHQTQGHAAEANTIIILLGILILTISGLNYVLLTLSSLGSRAKEIGVHKCNGASYGRIFSLLFYESLIYCLLGILLGALILVVFKGNLETITNGPLTGIFALKNLYATFLTALLLILISAVIPARVFASIPVTQVFRQSVQRRMPWKKVLLFIQLFATVFISSYLWVIIRQNNVILGHGPGYTTENIAAFRFRPGDLSKALTIRDELERMKPMVVKASLASNLPLDYPGGGNVYEPGDEAVLLSSRIIQCDERFLTMYDVPLLAGRTLDNISDTLSAVVNELFVKYAKWDTKEGYEDVIGRTFMLKSGQGERLLTVIGVCKDIQLADMQVAPMPYLLTGYTSFAPNQNIYLTVGVAAMDLQTLPTLSQKVQQIVPNVPVQSLSYSQQYFEEQKSQTSNRVVMLIATLTIALITIIGVVSYVSAELNRRRKEIAIRRINGGTTLEVLAFVTRGLIGYTLAACVAASIFSSYMAANWIRDFTLKATLPFWLYVICSALILAVVIIICILRSIRILSGNPVDNLKNE